MLHLIPGPIRARARSRLERARTAHLRRGVILLYHRVAEPASDPWQMAVSPHNFAEQMAVIRRRREARPLSELSARLAERPGRVQPDNSIAVTFDDGYLDNLRTALPILEREQVPATVYVISGAVGKPAAFWWDFLNRVFLETASLPESLTLSAGGTVLSCALGEAACLGHAQLRETAAWNADDQPPRSAREKALLAVWDFLVRLDPDARAGAIDALAQWSAVSPLSPEFAQARPLNPEELAELSQSPLIEIGGHTVNHPDLGQVSPARQAAEMGDGRLALMGMTGRAVTSFAYPFGRFGRDTSRLIAMAGFTNGTCSRFGVATGASDLFQLPRVVAPNIDGNKFEALINMLVGKSSGARVH